MTRVAVITGAARGIGAATVTALTAEGWSVIALDRCSDDPRIPYPMSTRQDLDRLIAGTRAGDRVVGLEGDATNVSDMHRAVAVAQERFGGLDAFIGCAGLVAGGVCQWELDPEQEQAVLEVNLHSVLLGARVAIPALMSRPAPREGRFVAVASAGATRGLPLLAAYCAAKAGVCGLTRALAAELRGTGITANAVNPGSTRTATLDESARLYGLDDAHDFARQQFIDRLIEPSEVAATIAWLCGPAGRAVTGANVAIDGGLNA